MGIYTAKDGEKRDERGYSHSRSPTHFKIPVPEMECICLYSGTRMTLQISLLCQQLHSPNISRHNHGITLVNEQLRVCWGMFFDLRILNAGNISFWNPARGSYQCNAHFLFDILQRSCKCVYTSCVHSIKHSSSSALGQSLIPCFGQIKPTVR